uniref:Uncharacterized protein n=1 Tax=Oryza meridionalis TaxID=40149 RepID=A0A0E0CGH8_9ORYZ
METVVGAGEDNVRSPCSRLGSWGFLGAFDEDAEENILARRLGLSSQRNDREAAVALGARSGVGNDTAAFPSLQWME